MPDRWSRDEVVGRVTSEIVSLSEDDLAAFSPFVVALEPFAPADGPGSDGESFWLIARDGDRILYWDCIEEEFAVGTLKGEVLTETANYGEKLEKALEGVLKSRGDS